jgi:cytochrome c oxidase subunit 2
MLLAGIIWLLTLVTGYFFCARMWWFPPPISRLGLDYDKQFSRTLLIAGIIFVLAQLVLGFAIARFRKSRGPAAARPSHGNMRFEALWTAATAALFLGMVAMGTRVWAGVHFDQAPPDAIPIEVTARQFAWSFRYAGPDGKFGRTDLRLVNEAAGNPLGLDDTDPAARDDIVSASLKIPIGKPVLLRLRSRDVIHNFFVPELRIKQDMVPGMEIPLHIQADKIGIYEAPCSELCGLGHFQMRTTMQVMSEAAFEQWKRQQAQR